MLEQALEKLSPRLRGSVITPADSEYETARKVYNGMIDRHPEVIVRCANVADVRASVNFAREEALTVAVRGGGLQSFSSAHLVISAKARGSVMISVE